MLMRHLVTVLILTWHHSSAMIAQAQIGKPGDSDWSPYRTAAESDHVPEITYESEVTPSEYVLCEPCESIYGDAITDVDLEAMRACQPGYVSPYPSQAQPIFVNPASGAPLLMSTQPAQQAGPWKWELLPGDVIWHSYWASVKEPRMSGIIFEELSDNIAFLDATLGGRASIVRYGSYCQGKPIGWELQIEGAGMPRINFDEGWDLESADFRFGLPLIYGAERVQWKLSYYHLSSHLGDEFIERSGIPASDRVNYARDEIVLGFSFFPLPAWRWYAEAGWAFYADEGADPWEFQFGVDYAQPGPTGARGTPFFAINGHLREEVNYGGSVTGQAGWLWRGRTGRVLRTGVHYFNGKSSQFAFNGSLEQFEQQIGAGLWYDF